MYEREEADGGHDETDRYNAAVGNGLPSYEARDVSMNPG
jgi:hypothetical protein